MKRFMIALMIVCVMATMAFASGWPVSQGSSPNSFAVKFNVINKDVAILPKGAPVILDQTDMLANGTFAVKGTTSASHAGVVGVLEDTTGIGLRGVMTIYGPAEVLFTTDCTVETTFGTGTTKGEAVGEGTGGGYILESHTGRGLVDCFVKISK